MVSQAGAAAVSDSRRAHTRLVVRNGAALAVTAASVVGVLLYPTSRTSHLAGSTPQGPAAVVPLPSDLVVTGAPAKTEYGPVQVRLRIRAGKVIVAEAVVYPTGFGLDDVINKRALPALNKEVLEAQSADIDAVSAATYTSAGYVQSLQSALDMAHLG